MSAALALTSFPAYRLDDILAQDIAILARKNAGKTYAAKGFAEHLLENGRRVAIIDPTGVWWGLRLKADGVTPAFPVVIFGGEHADVPIDAAAGAQLGEIIATRNLPCVVDLSAFNMTGRHRFVADFLSALHQHNRAVLHLIMDEADESAPQNPMPEVRRCLHEVDRIVRRGRVRGFRVTLITQRPAVLHKNVLSQASTLVAMRMVGPQDRAAIEAWLRDQAATGEAQKVLSSLASLTRGEGWVWAPDLEYLERVRFPTITTFDSSRSPEEGDDLIEPQSLGEIDLGDLRARLVSTEPEEPAATKAKGAPAIDIGAVRKKAFRDGFFAGQEEMRAAVLEALEAGMPGDVSPLPDEAALVSRSSTSNDEVAKRNSPPARNAPSVRRPANGELHAAGARMLEVLQRMSPDPFSWNEIATMAGLISGNGYFYAGRKALLERGLAAESIDGVRVTMIGQQPLDAPADRITRTEVIGLWRAKLKAPAPEMIEFVAQHGPLTTEKLAAGIGKKPGNGYWYAGMAVARNAGLIVQTGRIIEMSPLLRDLPA